MPEAVVQQPNRTRLLVLALALVVLGALGWWLLGSPLGFFSSSSNSLLTTNAVAQTLPNVLDQSNWKDLVLHGQLPITVDQKGRSNPFVSQVVIPNPVDRDARRLLDITAIRDALRAHQHTYGQYPDGTQIIVGSGDAAACLTDQGWEPRSTCVFNVGVVPMPADPGDGKYLYTAANQSYELTFTLEAGTQGYAAGTHTLTPEGIQ